MAKMTPGASELSDTNDKQLPNPSDILSGKVKEFETTDMDAKYSLTSAICYELKESYDRRGGESMSDAGDTALHGELDNVLRFYLDNMETELGVVMLETILRKYKLPMRSTKLQNWAEYHIKNRDYILARLEGGKVRSQ